MKLPFHGVIVCGDILFAARGANIHSFNSDGAHVSCWKYPVEIKAAKDGQDPAPTPPQDDNGPPAKRVKLENNEPEARKKGQPKKPGPFSQPSERPMVIIMTSTKDDDDASYLVAVTSDKSIWVFEHDGRGGLRQLSRRIMPKRPCSIVLTPDKEILSADKFGDVYLLPLIPSDNPIIQPQAQQETSSNPATPAAAAAAATTTATATSASPSPAPAPTSHPEAFFTSQATELTVHTKRNRQALLDQQISRSKGAGGTPKRVNEAFERHLLLGHVSLLTAIALGHDEQGRRYILTADRDEHIRVSRGTREQAHVIESYCMGHDEFVNRLLIPEGKRDILLSAGGDGSLFVWRWRQGTLLGRVDLLERVSQVVNEVEKIAVTGLCCWANGEEEGTRILVICERVPAIFLFNLKGADTLEFSRTIDLPGNPFEIAIVDAQHLIVAVDPDHRKAGAYDVRRSLLRVKLVDSEYHVSEDVIQNATVLEAEVSSDDDVSEQELGKLLYTAETLRKGNFEGRGDAEEMKADEEG